MASWQRDHRGVDGDGDGGLQGKERADNEVGPGDLPEDEQRRHSGVEDEFTREGPVDAIDMAEAEEFLKHREVEEGGQERECTVGESAGGECGGGEKDRGPVGWEEACKSGCGKVGGGAGVTERHEDDEAADDEEEFHAEVAMRNAEGWPELRVVVLKIRGLVKGYDGNCGDAAERVEGLEP